VTLSSVYRTKTAIDIFIFYRFIFFTLFKLRVSTFFIKDHDDDVDDDVIVSIIIIIIELSSSVA